MEAPGGGGGGIKVGPTKGNSEVGGGELPILGHS